MGERAGKGTPNPFVAAEVPSRQDLRSPRTVAAETSLIGGD